jgi:hypothetical protein
MKYTVVLLRPPYLSEATGEKHGQDIYVAQVTARDITDAIFMAQAEAFDEDKEDEMFPVDSKDYKLCTLFEGHQSPKLFGWQIKP